MVVYLIQLAAPFSFIFKGPYSNLYKHKEISFDEMFTLQSYTIEDEFYSDQQQLAVYDQCMFAFVDLPNVSDVDTI